MTELQRYALFGAVLFAPIVALFCLDILRARSDPAFHAAFPSRGRVTPAFWLLVAAEALLAGVFPAGLGLPGRVLVALGFVAGSAVVGAVLLVAVKALGRSRGEI